MTVPGHARETQRLELFVRSLSPPSFRTQQEHVVNRLERLEAVNAIADFTVEVWGDCLAKPDVHRTEAGRRIFGRIERFREWADDYGASLETFFSTGTVESKITAETYTEIAFPAMTLAEFGSDGLRFVSPCTDGERVYTVSGRLDALEAASPLSTGDDEARQPVEEGTQSVDEE